MDKITEAQKRLMIEDEIKAQSDFDNDMRRVWNLNKQFFGLDRKMEEDKFKNFWRKA